jgi:hypothetical protein
MNISITNNDNKITVEQNKIIGYRFVKYNFTVPFFFTPPCIEIILKNNRSIYISGNADYGIDTYLEIEKTLRNMKIYEMWFTKLDINMFIILALPLLFMMVIEYFSKYDSTFLFGYFALIHLIHIVLTYKNRIQFDIADIVIEEDAIETK